MKLILPVLATFCISASAQVPALDPAGLEKTLTSGKWALIEFGGPHCVPCKKMQPILAELQTHFGDRAIIRNVYITEQRVLGDRHKVMVMPTQILFDAKGKEVIRHMGFWEKDEVLAALAKAGLK